MSDSQWYYSNNGRERGPVPMARLKELAAAGTVKASDLVWREGMEDWTPASGIEGLFPLTPPPVATPPAARPAVSGSASALEQAGTKVRGAVAELVRPGSRSAQALLISGIVLVVLARGCDTLNQRNVARLAAKQAAARQQFDDEWETKRLGIQQQIDTLTSKPSATPDDQKRIAELRTRLNDILKDQGEERKELTEGSWRNLEISARNAKWNHAMWGYWHEWLFVVGTIAFTVGLILIGFGSQGPERWIALAMLGIIAYSLFVEGAAWMAPPG